MNIYELEKDILEVTQMMEDPELNIDDQTLLDTLEAVQGNYDNKLNGYCKAIINYGYSADALREEVKRINQRIKMYENIQQRLKSIMASSIQRLGESKHKTDLFRINRLTDTKLDISGSVPDEFKKEVIRKEPDRDAIKTALNEGQELGFARYVKSCTIQ